MSISSPHPELRPIHGDQSTVSYLREMWQRRHLAVAIPLEEIRVSHQNTFLGNVWHLGHPMLTVGVYYVIFGLILDTNRGVENFIVWLMIGVFAYHLTSRTVLAGARSISGNQGLMRSIRFPRALLPVSVVVERLLTYMFELAILCVVALATGESLSTRWLALPLVVVLHSTLNLGGAFVTARLNDAFQDIQQVIPFLFRLGTYASGVMFPLSMIIDSDAPGWVKSAVVLNPLVSILNVYRWVFLGEQLDVFALVRSAIVSVVLLVVSFRFFRAAESRYGRA